MLLLVAPSLARSCIEMKFGMAIAARIPMITTTIISSIRVKPRSLFRISLYLLPWACRTGPGPRAGLRGWIRWVIDIDDEPAARGRRTPPRPVWLLAAAQDERQVSRAATAGDRVLHVHRVGVGEDALLREARRQGRDEPRHVQPA